MKRTTGTTAVRRHGWRQSGAAAVEFAIVFPLLLFVVYSTIVYGYVFFLQQTINLIAQECAKAAVAVATYDSSGNPISKPDYNGAVTAYFDAAMTNGLLSVLPAAQQADLAPPTVSGPFNITDANGNPVGQGITVTVQFLDIRTVFPQLSLPGIGTSLPPLPVQLTANATARVS